MLSVTRRVMLIKRNSFKAVRALEWDGIHSLTLVFFKGPCWLKLSENTIVLVSHLNCKIVQEGACQHLECLRWWCWESDWHDVGMGTKIPRTQACWAHLPLCEWGSWPQAWLPLPPLPTHPAEDWPIPARRQLSLARASSWLHAVLHSAFQPSQLG